MHKGHGDSAHTASRAIVNKFHGPHRATNEEGLSAGFVRDEFTDLLMESFPTSWAGDLSNAPRTNSNSVDHPQNREIFMAHRTGGNKLMVHKNSFAGPGCSAQFFRRGVPEKLASFLKRLARTDGLPLFEKRTFLGNLFKSE